jgi:hypothetical protein
MNFCSTSWCLVFGIEFLAGNNQLIIFQSEIEVEAFAG